MESISILSKHTQNKIDTIEREKEELTDKLQKIESALKKYGMNIDKLIKE